MGAEVVDRLKALAQAGINVLLTGGHGIGKTTLFSQLCCVLNMRGAYINVPSADYFVDWLGIPAPSHEPETIKVARWFAERNGDSVAQVYLCNTLGISPEAAATTLQLIKADNGDGLQFLRPKRLDNVEWVFFDEINREADPRFLDACMELVQFRTVNGVPVPNLKLVWAAQNPPNEIYKVKELDVPLVDKFGAHVYLEGAPSYDWYVAQGYDPGVVNTVMQWHAKDLDPQSRKRISPRCLENILRLIHNGIDVQFGLLTSLGVPGHMLTAKLTKAREGHKYEHLDLLTIAETAPECAKYASTDHDFCAFYTDLLLAEEDCGKILRTVYVFMSMSYEYQSKVFTDLKWAKRVLAAAENPEAHGVDRSVKTIPEFNHFVEMIRQYTA